MIKCSLCTQEFREDDPELFQRIVRHEKFHKSPIKNITKGKVEWINV